LVPPPDKVNLGEPVWNDDTHKQTRRTGAGFASLAGKLELEPQPL
jgi:hypothetical protein